MNNKPVLTYDWEAISIPPLEISVYSELFRSLEASEARTPFGIDTTLVDLTPSGELFGALWIDADHNNSVIFSVFNTLIRKVFPASEIPGKDIGIGKDF
ncbi:hypothetical protein [Yersinia intermedia]|uniref:hypothetical protein n=1 Tax=Yersinia intermedia TaxID=631 RepID=UPI00119D38F4|nr:hypothetical protein [Yersinia intermedia]